MRNTVYSMLYSHGTRLTAFSAQNSKTHSKLLERYFLLRVTGKTLTVQFFCFLFGVRLGHKSKQASQSEGRGNFLKKPF